MAESNLREESSGPVVRDYITSTLLNGNGHTTLDDDENLLGSGLVDSVGMMSLVLFIEERFGLEVPPEDVTIEHFLSLNTIDAYLSKRRA
jgi:acyl carrier protein